MGTSQASDGSSNKKPSHCRDRGCYANLIFHNYTTNQHDAIQALQQYVLGRCLNVAYVMAFRGERVAEIGVIVSRLVKV